MNLNTQANLSEPDTFYAALTDVHRQLDREQSECVNARLILLLANHIGQMDVLNQALRIAEDIE
ncbi:MAG: hypothetical protein ACJAYN_003132 [Bermanella sp.]|jgi:hypothetical protein|uniref:DUF2783 domain-containing protein n=1 Tax=Glaciecola sp. 33A TaxID=2057807 RepID=UPI000C321DE5|nr:DUF2783 domain-containing protein [Glaciecola sp. 33A]PKI02328.1 hypothetical protein CXF81_06610 [Glaciecola sp. 33A]